MTLVPLEQTITSNGTFTFNPLDYSADGFSSVTIIVNVPQTVTTGYLLKSIYGHNESSGDHFSSLASSWQNNTTITVYGDTNRRMKGSYMYYDSTTRRINWVTTNSIGGVDITFSATQYYIRQQAWTGTTRPFYIRLYDIGDVNVGEIGMLSLDSYVTIPENIVVNL